MFHETLRKTVIARELAEVLAELSRREPIFHRPEFGTTRADSEK
jgi:hypothetical protein